jgi:type I site-specific restriction-modification system R (restriction) subunit
LLPRFITDENSCRNLSTFHSGPGLTDPRSALWCSFVGFIGTPIEKTDANTRAVFGDYISIYDIQRAVADKATVAIYYESRAAKLGLNQNDLPNIDQEFEAIIEGKKPKEERMGHANSSRSRIFRALRKSSSHHATSPVCRGGLTSWSFLRAFVASAWTTRKW